MELMGLVTDLGVFLRGLFTNELLSAFLGAAVGGLFTMRATARGHRLASAAAEKARDQLVLDAENERQQELINTTQLILVEITTAWAVYREEYAEELMTLPEGAPYVCTFPIGANPFPLFDSAPRCLAQLHPDTAGLIVRIYMRAKGLISMIEMNNADSERAHDHSRAELRKLYNQLVQTGEPIPADVNQRLGHFYEQETQKMATLTGMGDTADGMKGLTQEIDVLLAELNRRISVIARPLGPAT